MALPMVPQPRHRRRAMADELCDAVEQQKDVIATLPFWDAVMNHVNTMFSNFGSVHEYFMKTYPTLDDRKKLTQKLMEHFPAAESLSLPEWTPGVKNIALWQLCFHVEAGNKGLVIQDFMKNLVMLMLIQGPRTNAQTQAGVEYLVIQPLVPCYFSEPWQTDLVEVGTFECQSIAFTKGWTRSLAALYAAELLIEFDLIDHYKNHLSSSYENFCNLKGMVTGEYANELDRINANRGSLV